MESKIYFRARCSCGNVIRKEHPVVGFAEVGCPECFSAVKGYASPESDPPQHIIPACRCGHFPGTISRTIGELPVSVHCVKCGRNGPKCPTVSVAISEWADDMARLSKEEPFLIRPPLRAEDLL